MSDMSVPLLDLRRTAEDLDPQLEEAFRRVLKSGHYILGPEVEALERDCAEYVGCRHGIGVSSGTDALLMALMALGIGHGDEVICPTYTFFATAGVVWRLGATPVFVDSHPRCFNLLPEDVERRLTSRTRAIVPVHLFGQCAEMEPILHCAERRGIPVIEDAAQAIGSEYRGRRAGSMGAFGCFSFFPSKNLGGFGDSGLITTNDDGLAERARVLRAHGGKPKYFHGIVGGNFRMDALQAALIRVKFKRLDEYTRRRQENARLYTQLLVDSGLAASGCGPGCSPTCPVANSDSPLPIVIPSECRTRHTYNQFVVRIPGPGRRDALQAALKARGIATEVYYPVPMHLQQCFSSLGHQQGDFPNAEAAANETLALPVFPELSEREIRYVVMQMLEALVGR